MLIFSQNGEKAFDTTGGSLYIEPWRTGPDMNVLKYSVYGLGSMGSLRLATTDTMQSAKNIIKAINILSMLGFSTVDLCDDIDTFVKEFEPNKDIYYDQIFKKLLGK